MLVKSRFKATQVRGELQFLFPGRACHVAVQVSRGNFLHCVSVYGFDSSKIDALTLNEQFQHKLFSSARALGDALANGRGLEHLDRRPI